MTDIKDWTQAAADEIYHGGEHGEHKDTSPEVIASVIRAHQPRCKTCTHWGAREAETGLCLLSTNLLEPKMFSEGSDHIVTSKDFGCTEWEER